MNLFSTPCALLPFAVEPIEKIESAWLIAPSTAPERQFSSTPCGKLSSDIVERWRLPSWPGPAIVDSSSARRLPEGLARSLIDEYRLIWMERIGAARETTCRRADFSSAAKRHGVFRLHVPAGALAAPSQCCARPTNTPCAYFRFSGGLTALAPILGNQGDRSGVDFRLCSFSIFLVRIAPVSIFPRY